MVVQKLIVTIFQNQYETHGTALMETQNKNKERIKKMGKVEAIALSPASSKILSTLTDILQTYVHAATSDNTRKAYQTDIRQFMNWGGLLPCDTTAIIRYLHEHAETLNHRTLSRRLTTLRQWHRYQNFKDPTEHPLVQKTLTGIKNTHRQPKQKAQVLRLEDLKNIVETFKDSNRLIDARNLTLLEVGYFGAFRRSELVNIKWEHITLSDQGMEILIPKSKTDQMGEGQHCAIPYVSDELCAVKALLHWQQQTGLKEGYIFRRLSKTQSIQKQPIAPQSC